MKEVIGRLEHAIAILKVMHPLTHQICFVHFEAVLEMLKNPRWENPEQWEQRTGKPWPDNAAVRILNPDGEWELMEHWRAKQLEQDLARLDKDFGDESEGLLIVCDRGEAGPPPKDWRPE
jgi:hypothetical protein